MLPLEIHSAAPSRTHLKSKIMETNGFKSKFRNVIKDSLGQLWLSVHGSKAHSNKVWSCLPNP